jgi:2-desacetyl-2-hydroxyethyl bacteriochlorophyllide A dehydrogenase
MKTNEVIMTGLGGTEVLQVRTRELPELRKDQVLVRVEAAGVAFAEVQMLRGRYPAQPKFPFVPGYDLVGIVEQVGPKTRGVAVGQRVAAMTRTGAWANHVIVPESALVPVPENLDPADAVAFVLNGVTAWQMLHRMARVRAGQTVLVHGASGGVGTLLTRLAVRAGARVIGTASASKHDTLRAAGAEPIDYRTEDVPNRVRELAPEGVHAAFDHVGGRNFVDSYESLTRGGTVIWYGSASTLHDNGHWARPIVTVLGKLGRWELARLTGLGRGRRARIYYISHDADFRADLAEVFRLAAGDELASPVSGRYPLTEAAAALDELVDGKVTGKLVLTP